MFLYLLVFSISFVVTFLIFHIMIPRLKRAGIVGQDMHKPGKPEVAEMGGLGIIIGLVCGMISAIALKIFTGVLGTSAINVEELFAVLATILLIGLIGIVDDLTHMRQGIKALMPAFAALPLAAIQAGDTMMRLPFVGLVDFKILYPVVLVPLGVTGAANAFNMLAGFNGLEAGMGAVAIGALAVIAASLGEVTSLTILLAALGALLATLYFNWYPARVFIGDVGTLTIGTVIATAVILGNFEWAGVILVIPHALDFLLKARKGFPSSGWWGEYRDGKLYCPAHGPVGLAQLVLKLAGGLHERMLVLILMGFETMCGVLAIWFYFCQLAP